MKISLILSAFLVLLLVSSCNSSLPDDLELRRQNLDVSYREILANYENVGDAETLKTKTIALINEIKNYNQDCLERGFPRDNDGIIRELNDKLELLETKISEKNNTEFLSNTVVNKYYQSEERDAFGITKQTIYFQSNGSGTFFWEWTVGGNLETGSSPMTWNVKNDVISLNYTYKSKHGGSSNESIDLTMDKSQPNRLEEQYGTNVFRKIISYSLPSSSSSGNMMDAMEKINDPTYCSMCSGTGIEKNRAQDIFGGESGRTCPMCNGTGKRGY